MDRKVVSITKAAELAGVTRRSIYLWMAAGKVEYIRTAGGMVRIFADTLWRDRNHQPLPAPVEASSVQQVKGPM